MATVKLKFRIHAGGGGEGVLYYQVTHRRRVRLVKTTYILKTEEWDSGTSTILAVGAKERVAYLLCIREEISREMRIIEKLVADNAFCRKGYTVDDWVEDIRKIRPVQTVFFFMRLQIKRLSDANRIGTARTYTATLNSFCRFRQGRDLTFDSVTPDMMEQYEAYLQNMGLARNTTSFYLRTFRTIYNMAAERCLSIKKNVFDRVYTGFDKTCKRAVSIEYIKAIKRLDLSLHPSLEFARDVFMFSFYMRGMSFVDIAYLRKSDLRNGFVIYCRRKTHRRLTVEWESLMQDIVCRYAVGTRDSSYLLPIIKTGKGDERKQYECMERKINRCLKTVARMVGLNVPLTMYVARHSWASIARDKRIPLSVISEGMGHDSEKTTQIYLASLDTSVIDNANRKILRLL
ncbi:MAG: site-specific integrase [Bacteroides sp.]|nr:site-specific integrase [Roseburia sp.]MCM1345856.1 site-specific integrase [Bacteroides sp.]MCM1420246.1 site-specific integrase [Bacteroides sp.]